MFADDSNYEALIDFHVNVLSKERKVLVININSAHEVLDVTTGSTFTTIFHKIQGILP